MEDDELDVRAKLVARPVELGAHGEGVEARVVDRDDVEADTASGRGRGELGEKPPQEDGLLERPPLDPFVLRRKTPDEGVEVGDAERAVLGAAELADLGDVEPVLPAIGRRRDVDHRAVRAAHEANAGPVKEVLGVVRLADGAIDEAIARA